MISIIAAVSKNRVIGNKGKIPWNIPEDKKFFKEITSNQDRTNVIVMGRKTYEEIGFPLPGRITAVISKTQQFNKDDILRSFTSLNQVFEFYKNYSIFICGGNSLYKEALPYAEKIWLTEINKDFEGDTYFPEFCKKNYKRTIIKKSFFEGTEINYVLYEKKSTKE